MNAPAMFPVPEPDRDGEPFWRAAQSRELTVQRCPRCSAYVWQPAPVCPHCGGPDLGWTAVSGRAQVLSWTIPRPPVLPAFADLVPFVVVLVQLDEGPRMVGQLVDDAGDLLHPVEADLPGLWIGASVELRWRLQGETMLPAWTLTGTAPGNR